MSLRIGLYHPDTNVRVPVLDRTGARLNDDTVQLSVHDLFVQTRAQPVL
jgi:hypothetical protein